MSKNITLKDAIINLARLNDGYIHLGTIVPILKNLGFLNSSGNSEPQRTLLRVLRESGEFIKVPTVENKNIGIWRHKDFVK